MIIELENVNNNDHKITNLDIEKKNVKVRGVGGGKFLNRSVLELLHKT